MHSHLFPCRLFLMAAVLLIPPAVAAAESPAGRRADRVGFIVPLSGPLAEFGAAIRNGVRLAFETDPELQAAFSPVFEDSAYESARALSAFHKLRTRDRIRLTYVFGGPMSEVLAPVAESERAVLFSTEYEPALTRGRRFVFRFANTSSDFAHTLLAALRTRGFEHFAIVKCENQYHNTLFAALRSQLHEGESAAIAANYLPGDRDFRAAVTRLRTMRFDALGLYLLPGMQNAFVKQLQSQGLHATLFGTDTFETERENAGVEETTRGAMYVNAEPSQAFREKYARRFGDHSQIVHAAHAYEFARLAGEVLPPAVSDSSEALAARFTRTGGRSGVLGRFSFSETPEAGRHFRFPLSVKTVTSELDSLP